MTTRLRSEIHKAETKISHTAFARDFESRTTGSKNFEGLDAEHTFSACQKIKCSKEWKGHSKVIFNLSLFKIPSLLSVAPDLPSTEIDILYRETY